MRLAIGTVLFLLACAPRTPMGPITPLPPVSAEEVSFAQGTGTATIEGQAFLKTRGGDVKYGAGNNVYLLPHTPHTFAWLTRVISDLKNAPSLNPVVDSVTRRTVASGDGRFRFENVPAGQYLVVTTVTWGAPVGYGGALVTQGGFIGRTVTAESGKTVTTIVTQ